MTGMEKVMENPRDRLIVALDVPGAGAALTLADALGEAVSFYKAGLELFAAGEGRQTAAELTARGKRVFVDLKLFDVPATVGRATARVAESGADFLTVHGDDAIMRAAAAAKGGRLKILAVTALTSLDGSDLRAMGYRWDDPAELALHRAGRALESGCDGVIASGLETARTRREFGEELLIVTPGVRPAGGRGGDDQKRVVTPAAAVRAGANHIVVGRPIRAAANPRAAAENILREIEAA